MSLPPVVIATAQAAVLSMTSNLIAQSLTAYRAHTAISFDYRPLLQFVIFAVLNTPPNFFWLEFLEYAFPSQVPVASKPPRDTAAPSEYDVRNMDEKEMNELQHPTRPAVETKLSWTHTLIKFTLDQTLGATFNTVAFIAGMAVIKGQRDQAQIWAIVQRDAWPLMKAGWSLWPAVSLLSFTVIPPQQRIVFGSIVGLAWGVYLSLQG